MYSTCHCRYSNAYSSPRPSMDIVPLSLCLASTHRMGHQEPLDAVENDTMPLMPVISVAVNDKLIILAFL